MSEKIITDKRGQTWDDVFRAALVEIGCHSDAAHYADQWEARQIKRQNNERNAAFDLVMNEIEEYLDQRADADQPVGDATPTPNEEMTLLMGLRAVRTGDILKVRALFGSMKETGDE